ncbi:phage major capsid protein [Paraferrimonas haliotis]|uniref:Phage capsid protein n=1 Tax=Paraferrimonas haliotis TaxID=2013866 RepID=A0AA37TKM5_9GAMM|nr:phage major capsid protein [Paraferrimonas haliotis]GLS83227.1 phage capsid protein [Paraferrimonas haliotis]
MKLHEMLQKRNNIAKQMRELNDKAKDEKRGFTDDENKRWGDMTLEHEQLSDSIEREEKLRNLDDQESQERSIDLGTDTTEARHAQLFEKVVRNGLSDLTTEERAEFRAMGVGQDTKGGFTVPTNFRDKVVESMALYGGLANVCQVLNTSDGQPMEWPVFDGRADVGEMIGENAQSGEESPDTANVSLGAKKATSKIIRISNELLQDSGVDIAGMLSRRVASRLGRVEALQIISGDGTGNNVNGVVNQIQQSHTANAVSAVTYEDLVELKHKVDPAYRMGGMCRFLFNDDTFKSLKLLKDSQNRPLWLPAIAGVAPSTIDGDQFTIEQALSNAQASSTSAMYGDMNGIVLRRVNYMALRRLVERYADYDQTGFIGFHRFDVLLEDVAAVAKLSHAAS